MFFTSKQKKIEAQLAEYQEQVSLCAKKTYDTIKAYFENQELSQLQENIASVHTFESKADDIRREIEVTMFSKALFPESRGDILGLLETMDRVPNQIEAVVRMLYTHRIIVPDDFKPGVLELMNLCVQCVEALVQGVSKLFEDFTGATEALGKIDQLESESDFLEAALTERVFCSNLDSLQKMLLRELVRDIAIISDRAENTGDRVRIIVAKRGL